MVDVNLDDIIERHSVVKKEELQKALVNINDSFEECYFCTDGFKVKYNEATAIAVYTFPEHENDPMQVPITPEQRNYFVKTNYWKRV